MIQSVQNFLRPDIERRLTAKKRLDDLAESTLLENIDILEKSLHSKLPHGKIKPEKIYENFVPFHGTMHCLPQRLKSTFF